MEIDGRKLSFGFKQALHLSEAARWSVQCSDRGEGGSLCPPRARVSQSLSTMHLTCVAERCQPRVSADPHQGPADDPLQNDHTARALTAHRQQVSGKNSFSHFQHQGKAHVTGHVLYRHPGREDV